MNALLAKVRKKLKVLFLKRDKMDTIIYIFVITPAVLIGLCIVGNCINTYIEATKI